MMPSFSSFAPPVGSVFGGGGGAAAAVRARPPRRRRPGPTLVNGFAGAGRESTPTRKRKRKRAKKSKKNAEKEAVPEMQKGKALLKLSGFKALDRSYPTLTAPDRTAFMQRMFPYLTKTAVHKWRVSYEKAFPPPSNLWDMLKAMVGKAEKSSSVKAKVRGSSPLTTPKIWLQRGNLQSTSSSSSSASSSSSSSLSSSSKLDFKSVHAVDKKKRDRHRFAGVEIPSDSKAQTKRWPSDSEYESSSPFAPDMKTKKKKKKTTPDATTTSSSSSSSRNSSVEFIVINDESEDESDEEYQSNPGFQVLSTPSIGPLSYAVLSQFDKYFTMFCEHFEFLSALQKTADRLDKEAEERESSSSSSSSSSSAATVSGFACIVCADEYPISFSIPCNGDEMHFLCRMCFRSNATITNENPITSVRCPVPKCGALFGTHVARSGVSKWDAFQLQLKNDEVDQRVAMAAVAQLHCPCGTVAVVDKEDAGNGIVMCPGCAKSYCIKCGNFSHGNKPCPPPADTMKWLKKHAKPCPNCSNQIQKNGGCDHMTCQRSAGGCGYEFWFSCGCPYRAGHKPGCSRPGER